MNYDYTGYLEVSNNSGFEVTVFLDYTYKTIGKSNNINTTQKNETFDLVNGETRAFDLCWCFSEIEADFENTSDNIHIKVVKKAEPSKIIIEKYCEMQKQSKISVWIESTE